MGISGADMRAERKRKGRARARCFVSGQPPLIGARNIQRKLGHVPRNERGEEGGYREEREREVEEREQKLWRAGPRL